MDEQSKSMIAFGILLIVYGIATALENGWRPTRPPLPAPRRSNAINFDYLDAIREIVKEREHGGH